MSFSLAPTFNKVSDIPASKRSFVAGEASKKTSIFKKKIEEKEEKKETIRRGRPPKKQSTNSSEDLLSELQTIQPEEAGLSRTESIENSHHKMIENYAPHFSSVPQIQKENSSTDTTQIDNLPLNYNRRKEMITVLVYTEDKKKNERHINTIRTSCMKDKSGTFMPERTDAPCDYHRGTFVTSPIGIPYKYYPSVVKYKMKKATYFPKRPSKNEDTEEAVEEVKEDVDDYKNYISLETPITIKQRKVLELEHPEYNSTDSEEQKAKKLEIHKKKQQNLEIREYFDTDGCFCSFNCIVSFLEEKRAHYIYKDSSFLLPKLYRLLMDVPDQTALEPFKRAPHWKLRLEYNGPLTDEEYTKCLQQITFKFVQLERMIPAKKVFEMLR